MQKPLYEAIHTKPRRNCVKNVSIQGLNKVTNKVLNLKLKPFFQDKYIISKKKQQLTEGTKERRIKYV